MSFDESIGLWMLKDSKSLKVSAISWIEESLCGPEKWFVGHRGGIYSLRHFGEGFFNIHGCSQELFAELLRSKHGSQVAGH